MAEKITKWEYMTLIPQVTEDQEDQLNRLGALGWELVSVICAGVDFITTAYFKRKVP